MSKPKIYLETTLFNYYFDKDRDAHADTVKLFREIAEEKYEAYTSSTVVDELKNAPATKSLSMLALIDEYEIALLLVDDEIKKLAEMYITAGVIPQKYKTDGIHIAAAVVNKLDFIVSMNFKHIVKKKTERMTNEINAANGYLSIEITTPMEVIET